MMLVKATEYPALTVAVTAIALVMFGCGQRSAKTADATRSAEKGTEHPIPTPAAGPAPMLTEGGTGFVRVKQYAPLSGKPTMEDLGGGTGYVLKNLNPAGIESDVAKPGANAATVRFGDRVTLLEKKDGPPATWLVADGQTKIRLPEFLLTANKAEIDFLRKADRMPESMVLVYEAKGDLKIWGLEIGGIGGYQVVESHGLLFLDYPTGTSPFAVKGNAVMIDDSAVKSIATFSKPPVFDASKKALEISSSALYYCVSEGAASAFERLDLKNIR